MGKLGFVIDALSARCSRTLTAVHEAILNDLVFPTEIVGKRTRVKLDGSKLLKVHLNNESKNAGDKVDTYGKVWVSCTTTVPSLFFTGFY